MYRALVAATSLAVLVTGCTPQQNLTAQAPNATQPARRVPECYGTFAVRVTPCPAKLTEKNAGSVNVTVGGAGVVLAVIIASDCNGSASVCDIVQTGYTQFDVTSVRGENPCGTGFVVFEGVTASGSPIGTATLEVVNKYC